MISARSCPVPIPADCTDGFNAAYWRRPHAYLDPRVWRPMSALARRRRWGDLLARDELDLGYRVVTAWPGR